MNIRSFARAAFAAALCAWLLTVAVSASAARLTLAAPAPLLQFTAHNHVLGFRSSGFFVSNGAYALHVTFVNAHGVSPSGDTAVAANNAVPPLRRVTYANLWDGITVAYDSVLDGILRSSYQIAPYADPEAIRLSYNVPVAIDTDGSLTVEFESGQVTESAPVAWQEVDGARVPIQVAFRLEDHGEVSFELGAFDPSRDVFIDPTLTWNTFIGGSGDDYGNAVTVDASGSVYVAGTSSATWGSPVRAFGGGNFDGFAAKINSSGGLTWNTFLGGTGHDDGQAIATDGSGNVYAAGTSQTTWGTPVRAFGGSFDAYVAKLNSSGAVTWSTFLGGNSSDSAHALAVDGSANVYVAGASSATWGTPVAAFGGGNDAFAAKLDVNGNLVWNTFMGGTATHAARAIAVDGSGNVYLAGDSDQTWGTPIRPFTAQFDEAFVAKLNSSGALVWNTFLGGSKSSYGHAIAVDGSGNVYAAGESASTWETPVHAYTGNYDVFAAKLSSSGAVLWNTFLGQEKNDDGSGIAVDVAGNTYVAGYGAGAWSCAPTACTVRAYSAGYDALAAKLNSSGTLVWNSFVGGTGAGFGTGIAVDGSGNVYIVGRGAAADFSANPEEIDAFVAKLNSSGALVWKTFLGTNYPYSPLNVFGYAIAVDSSGNVYVSGDCDNAFATPSPPVRNYTSGKDAFAVKLDSNGALSWSTFLGGAGDDFGLGIAVGGGGNVYVTGYSSATWQGSVPPVRAYTAGSDAFGAMLNANGALVWNTFLGGAGDDQGAGIAADVNGNSYISGSSSGTWGTPVNAFGGGASDAMAVGLGPNGNLVWNTFLGGSGTDNGRGIAVDGSSRLYVVGASDKTWGSPIHAYTGGVDIVVSKLNSAGALLWNTFLGGSGDDYGTGIAVDGSGNTFVTGQSNTGWGTPWRPYSAGIDAFAAQLNATGALTWNGFFGGIGDDYGNGIAVDAGGSNATLVGDSNATWGTPKNPYTSPLNNAFIARITSNFLFLPLMTR